MKASLNAKDRRGTGYSGSVFAAQNTTTGYTNIKKK